MSVRVSTILLALAGSVMALSVFDWVVLTDLPLLRNPAAVAAIFLMLVFLGTRLLKIRLRKGPVRWAIWFLMSSAVIELLRPILPMTDQDVGSLAHYLQWVQPVVLFIVIASLAEDARAFKYVWGGVVSAGIFMSLAVHIRVPMFTRIYLDTGRYGFNGVNLNTQAYWFALTGITLIWIILARWPRFRWQELGLTGAFFSVFLGLLGTASRGGFLALIAGFGVLAIFSMNRRNASAYVLLVPILIILGVGAVLSNDLVLDRLGQAIDGTQTGARGEILEAAWPMIKARPWTGYSPLYTHLLGEVFEKSTRAAHNTYAQVSMTFGIPVLLLWVGLVLSLLRRLWRLRNEPMGALFLSLMVCTILYSMTSDLGYSRVTWVMFALAANVAVSAYHGIGLSASIRGRQSRWEGQGNLQPAHRS